MKPLNPMPAPPLSAGEERWLAAYRAMDDECRSDNLRAMEGQAKRFPRYVAPVLRLVSGGGK